MKQVIQKIRNVFGSLFNRIVNTGNVAVNVTNILKGVINNPALEWVVELTPTKADDLPLRKAKVLLPKVTLQVGLAMGIIKAIDAEQDPKKAMAILLEVIKDKLPNDGKAIFYREVSGKLAEALSDGTLSTAESIAIVQLIFKKVL